MSLFETRKLGEMAPATKLVVYGLLGLWTVIVLFPLYWVVVTSVKLPIQVSLAVVCCILAVAVIASLVRSKLRPPDSGGSP